MVQGSYPAMLYWLTILGCADHDGATLPFRSVVLLLPPV
jgi:hypothetical protein